MARNERNSLIKIHADLNCFTCRLKHTQLASYANILTTKILVSSYIFPNCNPNSSVNLNIFLKPVNSKTCVIKLICLVYTVYKIKKLKFETVHLKKFLIKLWILYSHNQLVQAFNSNLIDVTRWQAISLYNCRPEALRLISSLLILGTTRPLPGGKTASDEMSTISREDITTPGFTWYGWCNFSSHSDNSFHYRESKWMENVTNIMSTSRRIFCISTDSKSTETKIMPLVWWPFFTFQWVAWLWK